MTGCEDQAPRLGEPDSGVDVGASDQAQDQAAEMAMIHEDQPEELDPDAAADVPPDLVIEDAGEDMARQIPESWRGHCGEVERFEPVFPDLVARWGAQDAMNPAWPSPVVFVGSSTMRRWETLAPQYSAYWPVQRGFGGAQLGEVAYYAQALIVRHQPRAVVVFAGTNDIAAGVEPAVVVERLRCLRERIGDGLSWATPLFFIGITPTPARWASWPQADAVNQAVAALAAQDPALYYVDVPRDFLRTGTPPLASLFVADALHLSLSGYVLWSHAIRSVLGATLSEAPVPTNAALARGAQLLIDLGPSNAEDGAPTGTDGAGRVWNSWHAIDGDGQVLPGERLSGLVTAAGAPTGVELIIAGGFGVNGLMHGGVTTPRAGLGALAAPNATQDFFYADDLDAPGALLLSGLDTTRTYTLRLYGARASDERRVTRYVVSGRGAAKTATLQTSGAGAGQGGANFNDDDVAEIVGVKPDVYGRIFIDLQRVEGAYAYLNALALVAE